MHHVPATPQQLKYLKYLRNRKGIFTPLPDHLEKYDVSLMIGKLLGQSKKQTDNAYVTTWQERKFQEELGRKMQKQLHDFGYIRL